MKPLIDFAGYYEKISNTELLEILETPGNYQKEALKAAKAELESRQLSDEAINNANQPLLAARLQKEVKQERVKAVEEKLKSAGSTLADVMKPGQTAGEAIDKTILRVTVGYSIIILLQFIFSFSQFRFFSIKDISSAPLVYLFGFLPFITGPAGVIMFFKRKPAGWTLLVLFTVICFEQLCGLLFLAIKWQFQTNISGLARVFTPPSPFKYIVPLLIYGSAIYALCKENIRAAFSIDNKKMKNTLFVSGGLVLLLMIAAS